MEQMQSEPAGPVVAVGELLWDLLPSGPRLGGTTANFAIACARLSRSAALVTSLGADPQGEQARRVLQHMCEEEGAGLLDTSLVQTSSSLPTGIVEVVNEAGKAPVYRISLPAAWDEIRATPAALHTASRARALCFGTLAQRMETSRSAIRELVLATSPLCLRVLDINVRAPFFSEEVARWSLSHATLVKISDEELDTVAQGVGSALLGAKGEADCTALEGCARSLLASYANVALLAVTMGARGSLLITRGQTDYHPGFAVAVSDTVGAGDAFTAGLVHARLAGASLAAANEIGNLCGSFVAGRPGATPAFAPSLLQRIASVLAADALHREA